MSTEYSPRRQLRCELSWLVVDKTAALILNVPRHMEHPKSAIFSTLSLSSASLARMQINIRD
jgi:hypothetical protein